MIIRRERYYNIIAGTTHKVLSTALYNVYRNYIDLSTRKSPPLPKNTLK